MKQIGVLYLQTSDSRGRVHKFTMNRANVNLGILDDGATFEELTAEFTMNRADVNLPVDDGATFDELTAALKETLNRRGSLRQIRPALRAETFIALQQAAESNAAEESTGAVKLPLRQESAVINELIREYLEFNGYHGTASVLEVEAGISRGGDDDQENELCREMMKIELGVNENTNEKKAGKKKKIPLLYGIVEALKIRKGG